MHRPSKNSPKKISSDSQRLIAFAQAIVQASSRMEERTWEQGLDKLLQKLLKNSHQDAIDAALGYLFQEELTAYEVLITSLEATSTSCSITREENGEKVEYKALLIAVPILAWTRFSIASGPLSADTMTVLSSDLSEHLLAPHTQLAIAPTLFAIDQLPRTPAEVFTFTQRLAQTALNNVPFKTPAQTTETAPFLADIRYVIAIVAAPAQAPLFRWQTNTNLLHLNKDRAAALQQWRTQVTPHITGILPGCGLELLLPDAYFAACREADKQIRPLSIHAAVNYLTQALQVDPSKLHAIIGSFGEENSEGQIDEYRISFTVHDNPDVVYGIVWPLYELENGDNDDNDMRIINDLNDINENNNVTQDLMQTTSLTQTNNATSTHKTPLQEILILLRKAGIIHIVHHNERFFTEYCDDCGVPLFLDKEAELVHAEMPEESYPGNEHFH